MPGAGINTAIAGHRTTFGGPFLRLGELQKGDRIEVTTTAGLLAYVVERKYTVAPDDLGPLSQTGPSRLTLTTCDPPGSAARRLIVEAGLVHEERKVSRLPELVPVAVPPAADSSLDNPVVGSSEPPPAATPKSPAIPVPGPLPVVPGPAPLPAAPITGPASIVEEPDAEPTEPAEPPVHQPEAPPADPVRNIKRPVVAEGTVAPSATTSWTTTATA